MSKRLTESQKHSIIAYRKRGLSVRDIEGVIGVPKSTVHDFLSGVTYANWGSRDLEDYSEDYIPDVKILSLDIETAPVLAYVWSLWEQNLGLDQIHQDWYILSWAAKWFHEDQVMYQDKSASWDDNDDSELLKDIHSLLDEADIIITQNGKRFDAKKLNSRFILNGMKPPSSYRHVDTLQEAKKAFSFTSNKLEYLTDNLCKKYKKLSHGKYPGFKLWLACLQGDKDAWKEMQDYNINDVLSLEELYVNMRPWMKGHPNLNVYSSDDSIRCHCGSGDFDHSGYHYTNLSKFNKFKCKSCGAEVRDRVNLLPKSKRQNLMANIT